MTAEAKFWDGIAEKYAAQPVKDVAAFQRKQAITREQKQSQGVTNVTFRHGSVDELTALAREQFDSVWAYSILHLVSDRRRTLELIFELLEPGSSFISSNVFRRGQEARPLIG